MSTKKCINCRWAVLQDTGYSNYTVEGRDFGCALGVHPDGVFDSWYGEDPRLRFAENCNRFEAGEPVSMDVEGMDVDYLTAEQKIVWDEWLKAK